MTLFFNVVKVFVLINVLTKTVVSVDFVAVADVVIVITLFFF